jgi:hypothetical protein
MAYIVLDMEQKTPLQSISDDELLRRLAELTATTSAPKKGLAQTDTSAKSRRIPAAVRRGVTARDGNRCRYVDRQGRRCTERHRLEFHHRHPYGLGGEHDPGNIVLACSSHNQYFAMHDDGRRAMERFRGSSRVSETETEFRRQPRFDRAPSLRDPACRPPGAVSSV